MQEEIVNIDNKRIIRIARLSKKTEKTQEKGQRSRNDTQKNLHSEVVCQSVPGATSNSIVEFRPHDGWEGEFGFDWMRVADTYSKGDIENNIYKKILGTYPNNNHDLTFIPADASPFPLWENLKKEYNPYRIHKSLVISGKREEYFVPWLSLYRVPDKTADPVAELTLHIDIASEPDELRLEYNGDYFEISGKGGYAQDAPSDDKATNKKKNSENIKHFIIKNIQKTTIGNPRKEKVIIKCIKNFRRDEIIKVIEVSKNMGTCTIKLAGKLMVVANSKVHRKVKRLMLVPVKTNTPENKTKEHFKGDIKEEEKKILKKILRQALIEPIIQESPVLELYNDEDFNKTYVSNSGSIKGYYPYKKNEPDDWVDLNDYLKNKFEENLKIVHKKLKADRNGKSKMEYEKHSQLRKDYTKNQKNYFIIFYLDRSAGSVKANGVVNLDAGYSDFELIVISAWHPITTLAHEVLHSLGLTHSFVNKNVKSNNVRDLPYAKHSFEKTQTYNIMDYNKEPEYYTWQWQWKIANGNAQKEP